MSGEGGYEEEQEASQVSQRTYWTIFAIIVTLLAIGFAVYSVLRRLNLIGS